MDSCRICKNIQTTKFLRLGPTPLANSFLRPDQLDKPEPSFPLDVVFCEECGLVQLDQAVPPEVMFLDYIYVSSTSQAMTAHFAAYADEIAHRFIESPQDLVMEMGSNDGCLLRALQKYRLRSLGVEPAANLASTANEAGIATVNDFFCERSAREIREREGAAKVIIGNNVLAHIGDLHDLAAGLDVLLAPDGVAVFEVPYLLDLLRKDEFDTIYHEHLFYFALRPLQRLFESRGMQIFDVRRLPIHGGSIRVYVSRTGASVEAQPSVADLFLLEKSERLDALETYEDFAGRVEKMKHELTGLLSELKASGARIAGYGAPAKGNTLLNYFQIGAEVIDFIVDLSPHKQGMYTPGKHIPVLAVGRLLAEQPDYVLLLAWNFAEEILEQQSEYLNRGGKFIVPIPQPKIMARDGCVDAAAGLQL
jgi:C-methyltransferase C-terminal domain/Putative zinc binding domain/Methyltransferase domain